MPRKGPKLTPHHRSIAERIYTAAGGATSAILQATYVDIEPLIRRGYVRVSSENGVAIYFLTLAGQLWVETSEN